MKLWGVGLLAAAIIGGGLSLACVPSGGTETSVQSSSGSSSTPRARSTNEPTATLTVDEDEFTGTSSATLDAEYQPPHGFDVTVFATPGQPERGGRLMVTARSDDGWRYLHCDGLAAIVDGEAWGYLETDHDGRNVRGSTVIEFITTTLTELQLRGLVRATEIRMRLCQDEWTWPLATLHKMRELWELLYRRQGTAESG